MRDRTWRRRRSAGSFNGGTEPGNGLTVCTRAVRLAGSCDEYIIHVYTFASLKFLTHWSLIKFYNKHDKVLCHLFYALAIKLDAEFFYDLVKFILPNKQSPFRILVLARGGDDDDDDCGGGGGSLLLSSTTYRATDWVHDA